MTDDRTCGHRWVLRLNRGSAATRNIVVDRRLLLGGSSHCDLRIAAELPPVHSFIEPTAGGLRLTPLHAEPWLLVDGKPLADHDLREGQSLSLAGVEFELRAASTADRDPVVASEWVATLAADGPVSRVQAGPARLGLGRVLAQARQREEPVTFPLGFEPAVTRRAA